MTRVVWTDEDEATLHAGRGVGVLSPPKRPPTANKLFKDAVRAAAKQESFWANEDGQVRVEGSAEDVAVVGKVLEWLKTGTGATPIDAQEQGVAFHMFTIRGWKDSDKPSITPKIVRFWVRARDLAFAIEALGHAFGYTYGYSQTKKKRGGGKTTVPPTFEPIERGSLPLGPQEYLDFKEDAVIGAVVELRKLAGLASQEDYDAAVETAAAVREGSDMSLRMALSYIFPTQSEWATADATELLGSGRKLPTWSYLLDGIVDPELAMKLALRTKRGEERIIRSALKRCGAAVVPSLIALYKKTARGRRSYNPGACWAALECLGKIGDERVADLLTERLIAQDKYEIEKIDAFFLNFPELSVPRLQAQEADCAQQMLERVLRANPNLDPDAAPQADTSTLPEALRTPREPLKSPCWDPSSLPPVLLADGETALPPEAMQRLGEILRDGQGAQTPEFQQVLEVVDRASLARMGFALFSAWDALTRWKTNEKWACMQLGATGDDEGARKLAAVVKQWSGTRYSHGVICLKTLQSIGTETALVQLHQLSLKARSKGLRKRAVSDLAALASARGLSQSQLADRLVPSLGLDAKGSMLLDFGARQFTVGFDEKLVPFVKDAKGKSRKSLPKAAAADDAEKAQACQLRWKQLKKDLRSIASTQIQRLEQAMVGGGRWSAADFQTYLLKHPLLVHIVRRLVWGMYGEKGLVKSFRVDESGKCVSIADEALELTGTVSVVHPLELGADRTRWAQVLGDYEILQPFDQLGRPVFEPGTPAVVRLLEELDGATVSQGLIRGLIDKGWERGAVVDNGYFYEVRAKGTAQTKIAFSEGINVSVHASDPVTVKASLGGERSVPFSELALDLSKLV